MNQEVVITASGPVGSGKSALLGEIEVTLRALGVPYRYADERAAQQEKNGTHADWIGELERTKPCVCLVEIGPRANIQKLEETLTDMERVTAEGLEIYKKMVQGEAARRAYEQALQICTTAVDHCKKTAGNHANDMGAVIALRGATEMAAKLAAAMKELKGMVK